MITKPDYETAATKALEILEIRNIRTLPIMPLPILKEYPRVMVKTFASAAEELSMKRSDLVSLFGRNQDAATFRIDMEDYDYRVIYNQYLPFEIIWRGIARELGHIILSHDGSTRSTEARMAEAMCFANHLLCPRPVIYMLQQSGIPLTMNVLTSVTGCSDSCVKSMRNIPGTNVSKDLNRKIHDQFAKCIRNFINFQRLSPVEDHPALIDFGTYMDGYEE